MRKINVAVVGATGLVGSKLIEILEERDFPIEKLYPLASKNSVGKKLTFKDKEYEVRELTETSFDEDIDIALFAAGGSISKKYIPIAIDKGVRVVDNSSYFRLDENVPLIIPEVNKDVIAKDNYLIANPNCSTIQSVLAVKPIYDKYGIKRIVFNTYQAVSGGGQKALDDLYNHTNNKWKYKIHNNVLAQIDDFLDNGYTKEEMKMINETHKILEDKKIKITATAVRVPIENSHGISINLELDNPYKLEDIRQCLSQYEGIKVLDDIDNEIYPIPTDVTGRDQVYVGRIRRDYSTDNGLNLWVVADNVRKGAATNAVENAEVLLGEINDI